MRKVKAWFDKYDWGTFKELGELILTCLGAAIWLYFIWLVLEYYLK
jgi:hypothetical protein